MIPTTIKYKILVVIIVVLCVCVLQCDGMPNGTITKPPQSTNKPTSQPNEDKTKWWKWLALPGAFAACIVIFKFVLDCFTWRKYEKANEIALNFMKTNKENYGIDYSSWLKIECCWSCCLSCSAVWFTQGFCRQKPAEKGVSYNNGKGDGAATETTHLISHSSSVVDVGPSMAPSMNSETGPSTDGECNTQVVESFSSRNNGMDDNNAGHIEKKEGSVVALGKIQFVDERLVKPVGINTKPTDAWSLISETHKLPEEGIEAFKNMIGRCTIITFHQFLKRCLRYGGFLRPLNRRSHFYHFGGKKSGLEFYQTYHKLALHPVLYYVALDWYHFKTELTHNGTLIDIQPSEWFKRLLNTNYRSSLTTDKEWADKIIAYQPNICITLINVPEVEKWSTEDHKLALGIMEMIYTLKLRDANIVRRDKKDESVWTIDVEDEGQNQIILKLSSSDLKSFPSGRQLDITDRQRVYFNRNVEQFTVKKPDEDGIVKIIINYSEKQPLRCGIYLGEKNQQRTNEEILTRRDTPKPCLESPLIKGDEPGGDEEPENPGRDEPGGDEEPENPGRDESDGNGPQKNPGASGSTEGSEKQKTDKQKIQDLIDSVDESLLFKDVYNNQKNRNELSADLNHNKRWYRVGEKIYRGREDEKDRLPELQDINNELSKQNRAFLVALQKKCGSLTWVDFKEIGIKEHKISELRDVEPKGKTIGDFDEDDLDLVSRALPETAWELYATNTFQAKFKDFQITNIQNAFRGVFKPTSDLVDKINTNIPDYKMVDFLQICATLGYNNVIKKAVKTCTDMGRLRETVVQEQPNLR